MNSRKTENSHQILQRNQTTLIDQIFITILCICLIAGNIPISGVQAAEVSGSARNVEGFLRPVERMDASAVRIASASDLNAVRNDMGGSYVLICDIDMSSLDTDWIPIGSITNPFRGKLDGQGHKISGFRSFKSVDSGWATAEDAVKASQYMGGLFGICDGAEIKNLCVASADVRVTNTSGYTYPSGDIDGQCGIYAGILAAKLGGSSIVYNCAIAGNVGVESSGESSSYVYGGGLIGWVDGAGIVDSYYQNGTVKCATKSMICRQVAVGGGICGKMTGMSRLERVYNTAAIVVEVKSEGVGYAGGLSGFSDAGASVISDAYNSGGVSVEAGDAVWISADSYAGGIVGEFAGKIENTYNTGAVTAKSKSNYISEGGRSCAGGILGQGAEIASVAYSVSINPSINAAEGGNRTSAAIGCGGFVRKNNLVIDSYAGTSTDLAVKKAVTEFKLKETYEALGWDFERAWEINEGGGYPTLKPEIVGTDEYRQKYIKEHQDFIQSSEYADFSDNRWAKIYWSEENNFKSNLGEALYRAVDGVISMDMKKILGDVDEEMSFKLLLADYVSDQEMIDELVRWQKDERMVVAEKTYSKVKGWIKKYWKEDAWGDLSDESIFMLYHYDSADSEMLASDPFFPQHLETIVQETRESQDRLEYVLGMPGNLLDIGFEMYNSTIDSVNGLLEFAEDLEAYMIYPPKAFLGHY